jgi:hypothetical protein
MVAGQGLRLEGRVIRADSTPLPDAWVVLHQVTMDSGGPRDSVRTGRTGAFRLAVTAPDTTALYMVSTTYRGLTYFSQVRTARIRAGRSGRSWSTTRQHRAGHLGGTAPHRDPRRRGSGRGPYSSWWRSPTMGTGRIAGEPPQPTWIGRIPADAANFTVGQGDVSSEAVRLAGDSVVVTAPIPPGVKQLILTYDVPGGREVRLPIDQPADRLLVLLSDTGAVVTDGPLMRQGTEVFDDAVRRVLRHRAGGAMPWSSASRGAASRQPPPRRSLPGSRHSCCCSPSRCSPGGRPRRFGLGRPRLPTHSRGPSRRSMPSTSAGAQSRGNRNVPGAAHGLKGRLAALRAAARGT